MAHDYSGLPRNFSQEQWLGVLAEQQDEIIDLLKELVGKDKDEAKPVKAAKSEELTEPSSTGAKAQDDDKSKTASRSATGVRPSASRSSTSTSSSSAKKS